MSATSSQAVTGVVLAGGESRRMGQNKALMPLGGERLVDRVVRALHESCSELLMVTNSPDVYSDVEIEMVGDVWPGKGSLGGIYSAIYYAKTPYVLVVACDMPFLQATSLTYLIEQIGDCDVVMPDVLGEQQPLHAIYAKTCLEPIRRRLEADRLKIVGFLPDVHVRTVTEAELRPFDPELLAFQNLNTPEEFKAAAHRLQGH